jgi:hypothetical protein
MIGVTIPANLLPYVESAVRDIYATCESLVFGRPHLDGDVLSLDPFGVPYIFKRLDMNQISEFEAHRLKEYLKSEYRRMSEHPDDDRLQDCGMLAFHALMFLEPSDFGVHRGQIVTRETELQFIDAY